VHAEVGRRAQEEPDRHTEEAPEAGQHA
jgi:hypothetical protein